MNQTVRKLIGVVLLTVSSLTMVYSQTSTPQSKGGEKVDVKKVVPRKGSSKLIEEFLFFIKDFKCDHQTEVNNLNIAISFRYVKNIPESDYPDFRLLAKDIETFLTNYPNEKDYWEIVNKRLTAQLMKKYPVILSLTSEIKSDPTPLDPYFRASRVTRERGN